MSPRKVMGDSSNPSWAQQVERIASLEAENVRLRTVCDGLLEALKRTADAISNGEGWHDENADDEGNDTCEPGEICGCELLRLVINAINAEREQS